MPEIVKIKARKGVKIEVEEVESVEGDRHIVLDLPGGTKFEVRQRSGSPIKVAANRVVMCG